MNTTNRPSADSAAPPLQLFASFPFESTLTRVVVAAATSRT